MRPMIKYIRDQKRQNLVGVEIGVQSGINAKSILESLSIKKLYLIDPYTPYISKERTLKSCKQTAIKNVELWKEKVTFIEKTSDEAIKDIHEKLDFVYIDGLHDYATVTKDIKHYYPLVKKGGVIGGHDFCHIWPGLMVSVVLFSIRKMKKLHKKEKDWWVIK